MPHRFRRLPNDTFEVQSGIHRYTTPWFLLESPKGVARKLPDGRFKVVLNGEEPFTATGSALRSQGIRSRRFLGRVVPAGPDAHQEAEDSVRRFEGPARRLYNTKRRNGVKTAL
jgi:hypothetical protein